MTTLWFAVRCLDYLTMRIINFDQFFKISCSSTLTKMGLFACLQTPIPGLNFQSSSSPSLVGISICPCVLTACQAKIYRISTKFPVFGSRFSSTFRRVEMVIGMQVGGKNGKLLSNHILPTSLLCAVLCSYKDYLSIWLWWKEIAACHQDGPKRGKKWSAWVGQYSWTEVAACTHSSLLTECVSPLRGCFSAQGFRVLIPP